MADTGTGTTKAGERRSSSRYEARRQEIVDIAARLFAERGFHATSLDDLSQATGLQRGGLYHYIGSKNELLFMIHERFIEPLLAEARAIEQRNEPADVTLQALADALMRDIERYRDQVTVFLHEWRTIGHQDPERSHAVMEARREFEAVVVRTLERGVADDIFAVDEPRLAMLGLLGMINYTYQWYRPEGAWRADQIAQAFGSFFLNGIRRR